jgi:hypothetical protein
MKAERKSLSLSLSLSLVILSAFVAPVNSHADELPESACAVKISFDDLLRMIDNIVFPMVDGNELELGYRLEYSGATIQVQSDNQWDWSSDDETIYISIWLSAWNDFDTIGPFEMVTIGVQFRQTRPEEVPTEGYDCLFATRDMNWRLVTHLPAYLPGDPNTPETCAHLLPDSPACFDWSWFLSGDPNRVEFFRQVANTPGTAGSAEVFPPDGCLETAWVTCQHAEQEPYDVEDAADHWDELCLLCIPGHHRMIEPVAGEAFPGVWVTSATYPHGLPLIQERINQEMEKLGLRDIELDGQQYYARCRAQSWFANAMNQFLDHSFTIEIGGNDIAIPFRRVISESGGVRIDHRGTADDGVYLLIIPANAESDSVACTPQPPYLDFNPTPGEPNLALIASYHMDFPKLTSIELRSNAEAITLGAHVKCKRARDCAGADADDDGYCDDEDRCPGLATGVNCDYDNDQVGDGARSIWNRCLPLYDPVAEQYQPPELDTKHDRAIRQYYCGGCDNCQGIYNPEAGVEYVRGEGEMLHRNAPRPRTALLSNQHDLDHDWIGDACDPDRDGDGWTNNYDCAPDNPFLTADLDRDGVCEAGDVVVDQWCIQFCEDTAADRGAAFDLDGGITPPGEPSKYDNCRPAYPPSSDPYCAELVSGCANPERPCGPEEQAAAERCALKYGNSLQTDWNGNGVGDQCEHGVTELQAVPSDDGPFSIGSGTVFLAGESYGKTYNVSMRLRGGDVTLDPDVPVERTTETRTAFHLGACECEPGPDGDWKDECFTDVCPIVRNVNVDDARAWNPIQAPEIGMQLWGHAFFPVNTNSPYEQLCRDNSVIYDRVMEFSQDDTHNYRSYTWSWKDALQFPELSAPRNYQCVTHVAPTADNPSGVERRITRIRAANPNFGEPRDVAFYREKVYYTGPLCIEEKSVPRHGMAYLGPPFILDWYPGAVDLFTDEDPWTNWGDLGRPAAGALLGRDLEGGVVMHRLGRDTLQVEGVHALSFPAGNPAGDAVLTAAVDLLPGDLMGASALWTPVIALYQESPISADTGLPSPAAGGARLHLGPLSSEVEVPMTSIGSYTTADAPAVYGARVFVRTRLAQIVLVGHPMPGSSALVAHRLDLRSGRWTGPVALAGISDRTGYSMAYDRVRDRLVLFGGRVDLLASHGSVEVSDAFLVDPGTFVARAVGSEAPPAVARQGAGVHLAASDGTLTIYGGRREGVALADGWQLDLGQGTWEPLPPLTAGPGALSRPMVYLDSRRQTVWVADLDAAAAGVTAALWARSLEGGVWNSFQATAEPIRPTFPIQGAFLPGRPANYLVDVDPAAPLLGQALLAELTAAEPVLDLWVGTLAGDAVGSAQASGEDETAVAFFCPAGTSCSLSLGLAPGWSGSAVPYTVDVGPATLIPVADTWTLQVPRDLIAWDRSHLVSVGPLGVVVRDAGTLAVRGVLVAPEVLGARGAVRCGGYLCVARPGNRGLTLVDLGDLVHPRVEATVATGPQVNDLAVSGNRIYLAQGEQGVTAWELSVTGAAVQKLRTPTAGRASAVAADHRRLVVAGPGGTVWVHELVSGAPVLKSTIQIGFPVERLRLQAGRLWAQSTNGRRVAVWRLDDAALPERLGEVTGDGADWFTVVFAGDRAYRVDGHRLWASQAVRVAP